MRVSRFEPDCNPHPALLFVATFGRSIAPPSSRGEGFHLRSELIFSSNSCLPEASVVHLTASS